MSKTRKSGRWQVVSKGDFACARQAVFRVPKATMQSRVGSQVIISPSRMMLCFGGWISSSSKSFRVKKCNLPFHSGIKCILEISHQAPTTT